MPDRRATAAGTIVARNYLPAARVLAESYQRHHPDASFAVLVVDADADERVELAKRAPTVRILDPTDLDLDRDEFGRMALAYSVTELCTAVKPWLLRRLLADHDVAIYLDPDIEVFAPFGDEVTELALEHGIAVTPHVLEPMPRDGLRPSEADIMASGVFNLGFIGVSAAATTFLDFWALRLRQDAISSITEQLFTDQRWVDNVPAMFPHTVITDPGYNVAYWNVYQRPLTRDDTGRPSAAGRSLRFYHYSGYRPEKPWLVSTHYADRPRILLSEQPLLVELFAGYRSKLIEAGYAQALDDVPYRWNYLPDGTRVSGSLRRAFRQAWVDAERDGERPPDSPFGSQDVAGFLAWATAPADTRQELAGLSRWATAVWQYRVDLQRTFPDPFGEHADGFRSWCRTSGVAEGELAEVAIPPRRPGAPVAVRDTPGVNVLGYLTAELGVGEMGRLVHQAVAASGLPLATAVEELTVTNRTGHPLPADCAIGEPHFPVSIVCVNADMTATTLRLHPALTRQRYVIGVWSWELADFPPAMRPAFGLVDEVWTISDFCARAIGEHATVPVHTFPVPVRDPFDGQPPSGRAGDGPTRFLFVFDHNSVFDRKNPTAAVAAFQRAFPDRQDVRLTIKSINGDDHLADRERLRAAAAGDSRIELIEHYLGYDEVRKLFANADCYVSLHRSEGFGLTVAEAMAHGLPVIATDYSATSELLTADTGWPIPYRLAPVGPGKPPYPADSVWAEPDLDAAVAAMREVVADPAGAHHRGMAARRHVLASRGMEPAAAWVRHRVAEAHRRWREGLPAASASAPEVAPLRQAREALRWRADAGAPSRLPGAPMLRRAVLRSLDHYDHHQRTVLGALMDGVERSLAVLGQQVEQLRAETAEQLHRVEDEVTSVRSDLTRRASEDRALLEADLDARLVAARQRLDGELAAAAERLGDELAATGHRIDELDRWGEMFERRGQQVDEAVTAVNHLRREWHGMVPAVRKGLLRHHDLLSPPPEEPTEAVPTDVGVLRLPAGDTVVLPWLRTYATWEVEESRLIDRLLPAGGGFVDIGAHVGYFTIRALHLVGPAGFVLAVEPWELARDLLERNVTANVAAGATTALTVVDGAAWDTDGPLRLSLSAEGNSGDNRIDPAGAIEVSGYRLDRLEALKERHVHVVKSDAQGRDHRALAGLSQVLRSQQPHVLCEFWPAAIAQAGDDPTDAIALYRELGYRLTPLTGELAQCLRMDGDAPLPPPGREPSSLELIDLARSTPEGFVTLWLRPTGSVL